MGAMAKETKDKGKSSPTGKSAAGALAGVLSLTEQRALLPAADDDLRRDELEGLPADALLKLGKRAASSDILDAMPAFVAGAWTTWNAQPDAARPRFVGFTPKYVPLLVAEALALDALHKRFVAQDADAVVEVGRRRRALQDAVSLGVMLRDQCARALRRKLRGDASAIEALDAATGTAGEPAKLVAGLRLVAKTLKDLRRAATPTRREHLDEVRLTDSYAAQLEDQADAVEAAESAARAAVAKVVTQDALDLQDGRVLHLVDSVWRAFRDAAAFVPGLAAPPLGAMTSAVAPSLSSRAGATEEDEDDEPARPADPTPPKPQG